jgi:hypothetical protein
MVERERYQDEMLNPGLSITVQREGPGSVFQTNRRKIVRWREPTVPQTPDGFLRTENKKRSVAGPMRTKSRSHRSRPYKSLRC